MKKTLIVALLIVWLPINTAAQDKSKPTPPEQNFFKFKPAMVGNQDEDQITIGAEFEANYTKIYPDPKDDEENEGHYQDNDKTIYTTTEVQLKAEGLLVINDELNPRSIRAEANAKKTITFFRPELSEPGPVEDEDIVTQERWYGGRLDGGLAIGYETDQKGDHQNLTAGAELGYIYAEHEGLKGFIPSVTLAYEWVSVSKSELQDDLTDDETQGHQRLRLLALWKFEIGDYLPKPFKPLDLFIDARCYKDFGRPDAIEDIDQDEAQYYAGALYYPFPKPIFNMISAAYLKVSDGRIPPATNDDQVWHIGIILWENKQRSPTDQ